MVTRSEQGLSLIGNRLEIHIPTLAQEVFDVSGAGDAAGVAGRAPLPGAERPPAGAAGAAGAGGGSHETTTTTA